MNQHVSFVLLAEFDIDLGAMLSRQFPTPLGTDEQLLAGLMLPDGAEKHSEDWTIFFLNQTPLNTVAPIFPDSPQRQSFGNIENQPLLYVLNLVRTKRDSTARRGGIVKAMAICTHLPYIHVFKPVLLIALDDYFTDPSIECLERLYDTINAMDLSTKPSLTRAEKLILRLSERKDLFLEKFPQSRPQIVASDHSRGPSRQRSLAESASDEHLGGRPRTISSSSTASSISSTGNPIWMNTRHDRTQQNSSPERGHHQSWSRTEESARSVVTDATSSEESQSKPLPAVRDTHYFETSISYKSIPLPIRIPLYTFPEEIGEYSMIQLIQTFSTPGAVVLGPLHPHLHTNGALTHPMILLFNAIVTYKRVLFLAYSKPAGIVSNYVLAACALGSGCGTILRGTTERMFPYANLSSKEVVESVPGFVAGVTNPIFEQAGTWDILCNIDTGKITVNKDVPWPQMPITFPSPPTAVRNGVPKPELLSPDDESIRTATSAGTKTSDFVARSDNDDNVFMEELLSAIALHYGENVIRARFTDYCSRFVRLASRFEEELTGSSTIGYRSRPYLDGLTGEFGQLGAGLNFLDETAGIRELQLNSNRIEGWRRTLSYQYYREDFARLVEQCPIRGVDMSHQCWRLRNCKFMSDREAELIFRTLIEQVQTYEQVTEFLQYYPPYKGGLLPIALGLFHQQEPIRDLVVELLDVLRSYSVGYQFLQAMNPYHRFAFVRLACAKEERIGKSMSKTYSYPWSALRSPPTRSETSL